MYYGGIPETLEPIPAAGITSGFTGCITSVSSSLALSFSSISDFQVTLLGTAVDFTAAVDMNNAVACGEVLYEF